MSTRFSSQLTEATAYLRAWQALKRPNIKRNEYLIRHWLVDVGVTTREHSTITNALASAGSCEEPIFGHQNPISLSFLLLFLCMKAIIRNRKKMSSSSNQTSLEIGRLNFALYYNCLVVKLAMKAFNSSEHKSSIRNNKQMSSSSNQTSREIGRLHFALYYNGLVVKVAMKAF